MDSTSARYSNVARGTGFLFWFRRDAIAAKHSATVQCGDWLARQQDTICKQFILKLSLAVA
jgi:hypothetical protein